MITVGDLFFIFLPEIMRNSSKNREKFSKCLKKGAVGGVTKK